MGRGFFRGSTAGGGGGGSRSIDADRAIRLTGGGKPQEPVARELERAAEIAGRTDTFHLSSFYGEFSATIDADCTVGSGCTFTYTGAGSDRPVEFSFSGVKRRAILTKNGITLLEESGQSGADDVKGDYRQYGAWMDHASFAVTTVGLKTTENLEGTFRFGAAFGDATGRRPSASATWKGVMVGTPSSGGYRGNILQGDATLTYTASDNTLDADFSKIVDLDRGEKHSVEAFRFENVPVGTNGIYRKGDTGDGILGHFYGNNHAETAGVFEKEGVVGAYGARRTAPGDE